MDDDDESMMIGIDFGTFKIDTGICGEEEGVVTLKTPEEFCWEYLDHDLAAQRAFEPGRCLLFQCTRHNLILTHKHTHTHTHTRYEILIELYETRSKARGNWNYE